MANLSEAEIELKKYQSRMGLWKTGIIGGAVSILTAIGSATVSMYTTNKQEETKLETHRLKNEFNYHINQYESLGKYIDYVITDDINKQLMFAEFFSCLAPDDRAREKWEGYCRHLETQIRDQADGKK